MTNILQEVIENFRLKNLTNFFAPFKPLFSNPSKLTKIYQNSDKKITKNSYQKRRIQQKRKQF